MSWGMTQSNPQKHIPMKICYATYKSKKPPNDCLHFKQVTLFKNCPQTFDLRLVEYYNELLDRVDLIPELSNVLFTEDSTKERLVVRLSNTVTCEEDNEYCFQGFLGDDRPIRFYLSFSNDFIVIEEEDEKEACND